MLWLSFALGARLLFACTNIISSHFRDYFRTGYTQLFFLSLYGAALIPLLFLIVRPAMPHGETWLWLMLAGCLNSLYVIPYFNALRIADTSIVASLYAFYRILTPFVAYALIGEKLSGREWLGLLITIPGGLLATYDPSHRRRFNIKAIWLMLLSSLGLSLVTVISKKADIYMSGIDTFVYIYTFGILTSWSFLLIPSWRKTIRADWKGIKPIRKPYGIQPVLSLLANFAFFTALSLTKASYVAVLGQFQSFFVLIIVMLIHKVEGFNAREGLTREILIRKAVAFVIMMAGVTIMLIE